MLISQHQSPQFFFLLPPPPQPVSMADTSPPPYVFLLGTRVCNTVTEGVLCIALTFFLSTPSSLDNLKAMVPVSEPFPHLPTAIFPGIR